MADHTKSLSDLINTFGPGPSQKWNAMVWGTDNWGEADETFTEVTKFLSDSQGTADAILLQEITKFLSDSQATADAILTITRSDGSGYDYFSESRSTYTEGSENDSDWTETTETGSTWT